MSTKDGRITTTTTNNNNNNGASTGGGRGNDDSNLILGLLLFSHYLFSWEMLWAVYLWSIAKNSRQKNS